MDPRRGCGVKIRRNIGGGKAGSNTGHQWIEFWEFGPNGGIWLRGMGFWPAGWFRGGHPGGNRVVNGGVTIISSNDMWTGTPGDMVWDTTRTHLYQGNKSLQNGLFTGTACKDATCSMIRDCLRNFCPTSPWSAPSNECRNVSSGALSACCLTTTPIKPGQ